MNKKFSIGDRVIISTLNNKIGTVKDTSIDFLYCVLFDEEINNYNGYRFFFENQLEIYIDNKPLIEEIIYG